MRAAPVALIAMCVALPVRARAQDAASEEAQLRRQMLIRLAPPVGSEDRLDFAAWGQLSGGARLDQQSTAGAGSLGLGARLLWSDEVCDLLEAGAQLQVAQEHGRSWSAEQWGSVCLMSGFPLPLLRVGHLLEWGARPALSARPLRARERYYNERLELTVGMMDLVLDEGSRLQLGMAEVQIDLGFHPDEPEVRADAAGRVSMIRYHEPRRTALGRTDLEVDVLPVRFAFAGDVYSVDTVEADPVGLRGVRLGNTDLYLDARVGFGWGLVSEPWDHGAEQRTLAEVATVVGRAAAYGGTQTLSGGVVVTRELWPTRKDEVLLDNRAELWGALRAGRTRLALRAFGAHTTAVTAGRPVTRSWTGGLRLEGGYALGGPFAATATVEGARSFYATVGDGSAPRPDWVIETQVALTAELDSANE